MKLAVLHLSRPDWNTGHNPSIPVPCVLLSLQEKAVEEIVRLTGFSLYTMTENDDDSLTLQLGFHEFNRSQYVLVDTNSFLLFENVPTLNVDVDATNDDSENWNPDADTDYSTDPDEMDEEQIRSRTIKSAPSELKTLDTPEEPDAG